MDMPVKVPTFQTPVELAYVPIDGVAETNVSPAPSESFTVICVEVVSDGIPFNE
jgi:hypothetical protein